ncbi:MAG: glycosyltransferase [Betaproteobacteria bacterium]|nr:glycosyltransferase [Betaproteobacteria bacterium]
MPSFNQAAFIEQSILSVLNQNYPALELLIIDGGSTDGSLEIIRKYAAEISYWNSETDGGLSDALKKGCDRSTGEVICWLNTDDLFLPGTLRIVNDALESNPGARFCFGHSLMIDPGANVTDITFTHRNCFHEKHRFAENLFAGAVYWTRDAHDSAGGIDSSLSMAMEYALFAHLFENFEGVFINQVLAAFRKYPAQKSQVLMDVTRSERIERVGTIAPSRILRLGWALKRAVHWTIDGNLPAKLRARLGRSLRQSL